MAKIRNICEEMKMVEYKKNDRFRLENGHFLIEIRQRVILPGAMCQVLSPRASLTSVFCRFPSGASAGQRFARAIWEQCTHAIITGMAPLFQP